MLTVSNYHYIRPEFKSKYPSIFGITPMMFENQLRALRNEGDFLHPKDLLADFENVMQSKENYHFVTFDDGLKEQYEYALPVLDALNIPAIFFANSVNLDEKRTTTVHKIHLLRSIISSSEMLEKLAKVDTVSLTDTEKERAQTIYRYDDAQSSELKYLLNFKMDFVVQEQIINTIFADYFDEVAITDSLYMDEKMVTELAQQGCLGSHTHRHYPLGLLDAGKIQYELEHSKNFFEKLTDVSIDMISYPYGTPEACTDEVAAIARNAGYKVGFTTNRGTNDLTQNALLLNRFDCNDLIGGKNFK